MNQTVAPEQTDGVAERLDRIEALMRQLVGKEPTKEWYTTAEAAKHLGKRPFTVREWCRLGRVHAEKRVCGRGFDSEWMIAHEELDRIRNHGLLPIPSNERMTAHAQRARR